MPTPIIYALWIFFCKSISMNINKKKPPFFSDPSQLKTIILLKNLTNLYICIIAQIQMQIPIAIT
jgi:hypothetical protein